MLMKAALHIMRQFVQSHHQSGRVSKVIVLLALILLGLPLAALAQGPNWVDFQAAIGVLGQANFTSNGANTTASTLNYPYKAVIDPTTGKLFVADTNNGRILRFASAAALTNGAAAEGVLGAGDFITPNTPGCTATQMNTISGIAVDTMGRLWVADFFNYRVLRFDNASSKANGASADGVLGQPNFTTCNSATTQDGMNWPNDVSVDSAGRLWVSEAGNHRVLRFDNAASKPDGANADGVLGQPNFTSGGAALSPTGMNNPAGVIADSAGHLWVADAGNRRVLRFDNAASKPNGAASADGVLGQIDLSSNINATTATGMNQPWGVAVDSVGRLYVSETGYNSTFNHRILIFDKAATLSNGAAANHVLGQPDFTSHTINNGGISAQGLYGPFFLSFDTINNMLWVADWGNHRVLRYQAPPVPKIAAVGGVAQPFELAPVATGQWGVMALSGLLLVGAGLVAWRRA